MTVHRMTRAFAGALAPGAATPCFALPRAVALAATFAMLVSSCAGTSPGSSAGKVATLQAQLKQLDDEATRVADASAIKKLQRAYGYYHDQKMWDSMADLFAADGTIEVALDGVYVGQKRVRQYLHALGGHALGGHSPGDGAGLKHGQLNDHLNIQPVITVAEDGKTAKGRWRAVLMTGELEKRATWGEGIFENEYVKQGGAWRISKLHWYQTFMVPYEGGWAKNVDETKGVFVSKTLPPDRPPTEQYGVWPDVYVPPFHYSPTPPKRSELLTASGALDSDASIAALQSAVGQLAHRLQRARDTDEIENLVSMYGYYLDKQQWDAITELFAEDSSMEISQRGIYLGKKSIRRAFELFGPQNIEKDHVHNHIQMQPLITVAADGKRAWVRSRALSMLGTYKQVGVWGDGVYENEMVKENGVWRFHKDHVYTTFFAPYEPGWATGSRPTPKASAKIPPDAPPSVVYESFPDVYNPTYHYKNPVTGGEAESHAKINSATLPSSVRSLVASIEATITRLEDEDAVENLQRAYGFYVDKAQWKDAADLFADDGTLELGGRGVFVGKARVLQYFTRLAPGGFERGMLLNHLQLQPIVDIANDGNTAQGRWRWVAEIGSEGKADSALWGGGTYENAYVRENGVWKIRNLHGYIRFTTPYAEGWGKKALPNTKPDAEPDRPPTQVYDSYPATFVAPFHYRNPVTGR
jgi:hypothetical protein